ncbi:hypothetical protein JTE90_003565 [Oedothorax gibbosus]|uniref:MBT domain-containing protein 1 n=1 Tax=Oedothorax gibbosus TaxID=931172 RepID=A0AAV6VLE2_9ARAC|nr:hypothetical protein JTE90_003565 [Oedothorax gibbosus]
MNPSTGSFNWRPYLRKTGFSAAPVSCFKHVALSNCWETVITNVRVEVRSPDCKTCCPPNSCCTYWLATVIKVQGYWGLLRYDGFDKITPHYLNVPDKWFNLCTEPHIHPIGWCSKNDHNLVPPKNIEPKIICWREFLMETMPGGFTLPLNFTFKMEDHLKNSIKKGMKLEVVDKNQISVVRPAVVTDVVGGRLHIKYAENDLKDEGFWCHERSPLIHPVGWAQIMGHTLYAEPKYARQSLKKTLYRTFDSNDATWDLFLPVYNPASDLKFKKGMKLEAIDPLNLSTICVATVTEVLRHNYLMIGIDGMMAANGSDWFCYHASSPCIFPVGFCASNDIKLTPPRGYKGDFAWSDYLKKTKAEAAPVGLFHREVPDHGFKEGMFLEAVDLMEPRLICVAYVTKVVGRLLKVHFDGWEEDYDQWCDCESPDLFPIGWCDAFSYRLEAPRIEAASYDEKKKKKPTMMKKRRRRWAKKPSSDDSPEVNVEPSKTVQKKDLPDISLLDLDESSLHSETGKTSVTKAGNTSETLKKRGRPPKSKGKGKNSNTTNEKKEVTTKKSSGIKLDKTVPLEKTTPVSTETACAKKLTYEEDPLPGSSTTKTKIRKRRNAYKTPAIIEVDDSSSSFDVSAYLGEEFENFNVDD